MCCARSRTDKAPFWPERTPLKEAYDKAERFTDYRRMFDGRKDIDAVVIATPDHHHAVAARWAMERGLHVYVQKPLTYSQEEGRRLLAMARANPRLVTQMGNQGHSGDDGRRVVELIRAGVIGRVNEVRVWTQPPDLAAGRPAAGGDTDARQSRLDTWKGPPTSTGATTRITRTSTGGAGSRSATAPWAIWAPT